MVHLCSVSVVGKAWVWLAIEELGYVIPEKQMIN
jgi:hypothetical protein